MTPGRGPLPWATVTGERGADDGTVAAYQGDHSSAHLGRVYPEVDPDPGTNTATGGDDRATIRDEPLDRGREETVT